MYMDHLTPSEAAKVVAAAEYAVNDMASVMAEEGQDLEQASDDDTAWARYTEASYAPHIANDLRLLEG